MAILAEDEALVEQVDIVPLAALRLMHGEAVAEGELVELPALLASFDSYTLTVSDTETELYVRDLLVGEVWISTPVRLAMFLA